MPHICPEHGPMVYDEFMDWWECPESSECRYPRTDEDWQAAGWTFIGAIDET